MHLHEFIQTNFISMTSQTDNQIAARAETCDMYITSFNTIFRFPQKNTATYSRVFSIFPISRGTVLHKVWIWFLIWFYFTISVRIHESYFDANYVVVGAIEYCETDNFGSYQWHWLRNISVFCEKSSNIPLRCPLILILMKKFHGTFFGAPWNFLTIIWTSYVVPLNSMKLEQQNLKFHGIPRNFVQITNSMENHVTFCIPPSYM